MDEKSVDVSIVDPRILLAIKKENYDVRAVRHGPKDSYVIEFGKGAFFATLRVDGGKVTEKTLEELAEQVSSLRKVITCYTEPLRYGPVSSFGAGLPKAKAG